MNPIVPAHCPEGGQRLVFGATQPEYRNLPSVLIDDGEGARVYTEWMPSECERRAIANGAPVCLEVFTFGAPLQPLRMTVGSPPAQPPRPPTHPPGRKVG